MKRLYRVHPLQVTRACDWCDGFFQPLMRDVMEGKGRFCSRNCYNTKIKSTTIKLTPKPKIGTSRRSKTGVKINLMCATCNKSFERLATATYSSASKLFFCSRQCKDKAQRLESNIISPSHYGTTSDYRIIAFRNYPKKCNRCNYDRIPDVLRVHHIDRNHENNSISNLEVLCPTCHEEEHFLARDGCYLAKRPLEASAPLTWVWKDGRETLGKEGDIRFASNGERTETRTQVISFGD